MLSFEQELIRSTSVLMRDEWIDYNEKRWGVRGERVRYTLPGKDIPALEGVLYLNQRGKIINPPLNAFLPFVFVPTATEKNCQLYHQWVDLTKIMALDIKKRGYVGGIAFPPGFIDGRAFLWAGINISVRYTFVGKLPFEDEWLDTSVRKNVRKARKKNYFVERTHEWDKVVYCLRKTTAYKGMDEKIREIDLDNLSISLGDELMFAHICFDGERIPTSAQVKFAMSDGICIDWAAGTDRNYINDGVNQLLYYEALRDIESTGTKFFNYCGANVESVAAAKAEWGFPLIPYIVLEGDPLTLKIKQSGKEVIKTLRKLNYKG